MAKTFILSAWRIARSWREQTHSGTRPTFVYEDDRPFSYDDDDSGQQDLLPCLLPFNTYRSQFGSYRLYMKVQHGSLSWYILQKILHLFTSCRIFRKASPAILPSDLDQDLASYGGIKSRIDGSRVPALAATTARHRHILLRDRRRQPASFDDPAGNGQSRVVFEQQIDLSGALSTLVNGPDDQRLSSSGISASPHTVDARGVRLSLKVRTWQ